MPKPSISALSSASRVRPKSAVLLQPLLGCRLPVDCLYDVSRRKTRRHIESITQPLTRLLMVIVAFPIEAHLVIFAEIDKHPGVVRSRRPRLSPINSPTSVASRCNFLSSSSLVRLRAADTARARSSCFLRSALRSSGSLEFIITHHYIDNSTGDFHFESRVRLAPNVNVFANAKVEPVLGRKDFGAKRY